MRNSGRVLKMLLIVDFVEKKNEGKHESSEKDFSEEIKAESGENENDCHR
jgi:hypothetical protein